MPGYRSDGAPPSQSLLCTDPGNDDGIAPVGEGLGTLSCTHSGTALTSLEDPPFWPGYRSDGAPPSPSPLCTALGNDDGIAPVDAGREFVSCTRSGTAQASLRDPLFLPGYLSDGAPPSPSPLCTALGNDDGIAPVDAGREFVSCTRSGTAQASLRDPLFLPGYLSDGAPPSPSPLCTALGNDDGIAPVDAGREFVSCTRSGTAQASLRDPLFLPGYLSDGAPPSPSPLCTAPGNDDGIVPAGEGLGTLSCTRSGTALTSLEDPPFLPGYPSGGAPPSQSLPYTALGNGDDTALDGEDLLPASGTPSDILEASPPVLLFSEQGHRLLGGAPPSPSPLCTSPGTGGDTLPADEDLQLVFCTRSGILEASLLRTFQQRLQERKRGEPGRRLEREREPCV